MALSVYKKGQGAAARGVACVVVILLGGWATRQMWFTAGGWGWGLVAQAIATALVAAVFIALPIYLALFHPQVGELLIETQLEMRKVAWSTRAEVVASTTVVIVTVAMLSVFIFVTDWVLLALARLAGIY